jgi:hypothetical protein
MSAGMMLVGLAVAFPITVRILMSAQKRLLRDGRESPDRRKKGAAYARTG